MSTQGSPVAGHRCHCRASDTASLQTPSSAASVSPTTAAPTIDGGTTADGGKTGAATGAGAATVAVAADVEDAVPSALVAVTTTSSVEPTSSLDGVYSAAVSPARSAHAAAVASQRCH